MNVKLKKAEYKPEIIQPFVETNSVLKTLDGQPFTNELSYKDRKYSKTILKVNF